MTRERDTKSPASVLQRLRNACVEGQTVQNAQILFVLERFLVRVSLSPYRDRMVLKGGILLHLMLGQWLRPTEDLDFLALGIPGETMDQALAGILAIDGGDGLEFDAGSMTWKDIREASGYPCRRYTIPYRFGPKHRRFIQLDLNFGDPVTPGPRPIDLRPILADFTGGTVLGYPRESVLAEKIETLMSRGLATTRSKDMFDLWVLSRTSAGLRMEGAANALAETARYRGTALDRDGIALRPAFGEDSRQQQLWSRYVGPRGLAAPPFREVVECVQAFVGPIVAGAIGSRMDTGWDPATRRWR